MIVCHCKALTDRDVCAALCCGATSLPALARATGAGSECGGCRPQLEMLLVALGPVVGTREAQARAEARRAPATDACVA